MDRWVKQNIMLYVGNLKKLTNDKQQEVLAWRKTLLKKVKKYTDDNLNPAKVNVINPTKDSFTQL